MDTSAENRSPQTSNTPSRGDMTHLKLKQSDTSNSPVQFHSPPIIPPLSLSSAIFNSNRVTSVGDNRSACRTQQYIGSNFSDELRPDDPSRASAVHVTVSPSARSDAVDSSWYLGVAAPAARHQSVGELVGSPSLSDYRGGVTPMYSAAGMDVSNRSTHGPDSFMTSGATSSPHAIQTGQSPLFAHQQQQQQHAATSTVGYHRMNAARQQQHQQQQQHQHHHQQQHQHQQQQQHQQHTPHHIQQQQRAAQIQNAADAPLSHWNTTPPVTARRTYVTNPAYQQYTGVHDPVYGAGHGDVIYATVGGHHHSTVPIAAGYAGQPSASFDMVDFEGLPPVPAAVRGSRSTANTPRGVDSSSRIPSSRDAFAHSPRIALPMGRDSSGYYRDAQYADPLNEMPHGIAPWHGAMTAIPNQYHYGPAHHPQSTVSMHPVQQGRTTAVEPLPEGYYCTTQHHHMQQHHHRQLSTGAIDFASAQMAAGSRQQMQRRSVVGTTPVPVAAKRTMQQRGLGRRPQVPPQQPHTARAVLQGHTGTQPSRDTSSPRGVQVTGRQKSGILLKFLDSLKASLGLVTDNTARSSGIPDTASPSGAFVITTPFENMTPTAAADDFTAESVPVAPHPSSPTPVYVPPPEPSPPLSAPFSHQPAAHGAASGSPLHPIQHFIQQPHQHHHQQPTLQHQPTSTIVVPRIKATIAAAPYTPPTTSTRAATTQQAPRMPNTTDTGDKGTKEKSPAHSSVDKSGDNAEGKRGAVAPPPEMHHGHASTTTPPVAAAVHEAAKIAAADGNRKLSKETTPAAVTPTSATAVTTDRQSGVVDNTSKVVSTEADPLHAAKVVPKAYPRNKSKNAEIATTGEKEDQLQKSVDADIKAVRQRMFRMNELARSGPLAQPTKTVRFSWRTARSLLKVSMQAAELFSVRGVPFSAWDLRKIPTLGASPTSCRVQEMFKTTIEGKNCNPLKLFVKRIPIGIWQKQYDAQNKWIGEYVTDGENFVMEAAALAFLQEYGHSVSPSLHGILEYCGDTSSTTKTSTPRMPTRGSGGQRRSSTGNEVTHVVIVSELYGEDLLDFLDRREKEENPLSDNEKQQLQFDCLYLLRRLHYLGLAHLDFTPENVLYGSEGLRLCDFAKATPLWTFYQRHVVASSRTRQPSSTSSCSSWFPFESCEPTVGKGAYMPPECWKVYWRLEETKVQFPLEELWGLQNSEDRAAYYFRVSEADVYMIGVLMFWIWSEGGIWKCSDPRQDEKYSLLQKSRLNFDLFRECRSWPDNLKDILQKALRPEPIRRATLDELLNHKWFAGLSRTVNDSSSGQFTNVKMVDDANLAPVKGLNGPKVSGVVTKTALPEERDIDPENSVVRIKHPAVAMKGNPDGGVATVAAVLV